MGCCIRFSFNANRYGGKNALLRALVSCLALLVASSLAASPLTASDGVGSSPYYALPGAVIAPSSEPTFLYNGQRYSYAPGLGWLGLEPSLSAPRLNSGQVYLQGDVLDALGVTLPRLTGVRSSGGGTVRVVFDFAHLGVAELEPLRQSGTTRVPLRLRFPALLLPETLPGRLENLTLNVRAPGADKTVLSLTGPEGTGPLRFDVFPLANPTRLVVDLNVKPVAETLTNPTDNSGSTGDAALDLRERLLDRLSGTRTGERNLGSGATLRSFGAATLAGRSQVDLVEIAPDRGRFTVQGGSAALRTPSELTGRALVGLNASYFDPASGRSIGLLKERGVLESLPSRNRAAIGFGFGRPVVGRPQSELLVTVNGTLRTQLSLKDERVTLYTASAVGAGAQVGSPRQGAVVVSATGRVLENKVGPRRVPTGGLVLSYLPEVRPLALVNAGETLRYRLETRPSSWRFVPEAVEAGPLLVEGGRSAFSPALEAFDTENPESNINRRTTRAALGVRQDGTVLLLVATNMTAAELVPLLLDLRAENALQLDSGGSSTLVVGGEVINRPAALQRKVATVITYAPY